MQRNKGHVSTQEVTLPASVAVDYTRICAWLDGYVAAAASMAEMLKQRIANDLVAQQTDTGGK